MAKQCLLLLLIINTSFACCRNIKATTPGQDNMDPITFSYVGMKLDKASTNPRVWTTEKGDQLFLYYNNSRPDIPASLRDIDVLRKYYRSTIEKSGGAILSVDVIEVDSVNVIRVTSKTPQNPVGITFKGLYIFAFQDYWYSLSIICEEGGLTGAREAIVAAKAWASGVVIDKNGVGWSKDPYDPKLQGGFRAYLSDQEEYDSISANHPLSRLRLLMKNLDRSIRLDSKLQSARVYQFEK